jgi:sec-independent protein translocase protein TatB
VFNLQGGELVIILLLALVVLGPEKLPDAMRKLGQFYAEMRKMSNSFQKEFKAAVDEPMREVRETANMLRDSADFRKLSDGQRPEKPKSAEMAPATVVVAPADPSQTPLTDVPPEIADPSTPAPPEAALEAPIGEPVADAPAVPAAPPPAFAPPSRDDWGKARNGTPTAGAAVPAPAPPPPPPMPASTPVETAEGPPA